MEGDKRRISIKTSGKNSNADHGEDPKIEASGHSEQSAVNSKESFGITQEEQLSAIYRVTNNMAHRLEKSRISQYEELLNSPWRLIWRNILFGAARGVGIAIGFTFFAATIIYVLQGLGALNLPIIGDYIADIVRIVQRQLELKSF